MASCHHSVSSFFYKPEFLAEKTDTTLPTLTEISIGTQNALKPLKQLVQIN